MDILQLLAWKLENHSTKANKMRLTTVNACGNYYCITLKHHSRHNAQLVNSQIQRITPYIDPYQPGIFLGIFWWSFPVRWRVLDFLKALIYHQDGDA